MHPVPSPLFMVAQPLSQLLWVSPTLFLPGLPHACCLSPPLGVGWWGLYNECPSRPVGHVLSGPAPFLTLGVGWGCWTSLPSLPVLQQLPGFLPATAVSFPCAQLPSGGRPGVPALLLCWQRDTPMVLALISSSGSWLVSLSTGKFRGPDAPPSPTKDWNQRRMSYSSQVTR